MTIKAKDLQQSVAYCHKEKYNIQLYKDATEIQEPIGIVTKDDYFLVLDMDSKQDGSLWIHVLAKDKPGFIVCTPNFDKFLEFQT